jgi:hypothetical protein
MLDSASSRPVTCYANFVFVSSWYSVHTVLNLLLILTSFFTVILGHQGLPMIMGKAIPLQALTGPQGSRSLRLPDFKTVSTRRLQGCQPYVPAAFTPRK